MGATVLAGYASSRSADVMDGRMTINTEWNTRLYDIDDTGDVVEFCKNSILASDDNGAASSLTVHLDYGNGYSFKSLSVVDAEGVIIKSVSSTTAWDGPYNNLKDITLDLPDGVYSVVAVFIGKTRMYHVTENVVVEGEQSLTILGEECTNEISFCAYNNNGERFITEQYAVDRYGNKTPTGYKNSFATYHGIAVYVNNRFFAGASSREIQSTIDRNGNISNGEEEWTVMVNDFSNACGVVGFTLAVTPEGTYAISLPADGCGTQTVTNDYTHNMTREVKFIPTRNQRHALNSRTTTQSYATSIDIIEGKGEDMRLRGMGTTFLHFQGAPGDTEAIPEIADAYIFNEQDPAGSCPLVITTSPASDELLVYDVDNGRQNKYYTTAQPFVSPDCVKVSPSIYSYTQTDDPHNLVYPFNDNYQYDNSEPVCLGGNVPVLTFANGNVVSEIGPWAYTGMDFVYIGRYGEKRDSDPFFTTVTRNHKDRTDEQTVSGKLSDSGVFGVVPPVLNGFEKIKLNFHNDNINVDGMTGVNDTEINYYCDKTSRHNPLPVLRMLQIREGGKVTDRISDAENATLGLSVGNFKPKLLEAQDYTGEWVVRQKWFEYWDVPFDVKVEYAPYSSGEWKDFSIGEVESQFQPQGWGRFFSGSFAQVREASENNWYDLRVSITFDENNNQIQILSPAFYLDNSSNCIESITSSSDSAPAYYNLQGVRIEKPSAGQLMIEVRNGKGIKKIIK